MCTCGMTNTGQESPSISTACTLAMSGIDTTKLIMIMTIRPQKWYKDTNSIYSTRTLSKIWKAPNYTIEKDDDRTDQTCILRFHVGLPNEDMAFRIVNKEWEYSHKKGFKCTFEGGILCLYFNFKRYRYRWWDLASYKGLFFLVAQILICLRFQCNSVFFFFLFSFFLFFNLLNEILPIVCL